MYCPVPQMACCSEHSVLPVPALNCPSGQSMHSLAPSLDWNFPASQAVGGLLWPL
jgi:hypothetical protein